MHITSSLSALKRIGISGIKELSKGNLEDGEREILLEELREGLIPADEHDSELESNFDTDISNYCNPSPKKNFRKLKTRIHFFKISLSVKEKGSYKVSPVNRVENQSEPKRPQSGGDWGSF